MQRVIYIEPGSVGVNLRQIYDSMYAKAEIEVARFCLPLGAPVGSHSTSEPALRTGECGRQRECKQCGGPIIGRRSYAKHCSDKCRRVYQQTRVDKEHIRARRRKRHAETYRPVDYGMRRCAVCGDDFKPKQQRSKLCSKRCKLMNYWATCGRQRPSGSNSLHRARRWGVEREPVNRRRVFDRDGWRCQACRCYTPKELIGKNFPNSPELDHAVPLSRGGPHTYANVQLLCRRCNGDKLAMTMQEFLACLGRTNRTT